MHNTLTTKSRRILEELRLEEFTQRHIAEKYGVSYQRINQLYRRYISTGKKEKPTIQCKECSVKFKIYPCRLGTIKYCGKKCRTLARRNHDKEKQS